MCRRFPFSHRYQHCEESFHLLYSVDIRHRRMVGPARLLTFVEFDPSVTVRGSVMYSRGSFDLLLDRYEGTQRCSHFPNKSVRKMRCHSAIRGGKGLGGGKESLTHDTKGWGIGASLPVSGYHHLAVGEWHRLMMGDRIL
jgi:hypothetical protein